MVTIVHYPRTEHDLKKLQIAVASVHADAVIAYIKSLTCSFDQKMKLVKSLLENRQ